MRLMVSGHRREKLVSYDTEWIRDSIWELVHGLSFRGLALGLSGMASGVDLWFCDACSVEGVPFTACVPFEGQEQLMSREDRELRAQLLVQAADIKNVRNGWMVEHCDAAIVVWDGNKGGTHNVLQQLLEVAKPIWWLEPKRKKVIEV